MRERQDYDYGTHGMNSMISMRHQKEVSELSKHMHCSPEDQFFGSVTVGERGQVVIPAEARKRLNIQAGDKLLVMGHPFAEGLVLAKLDSLREALSSFLEGLSGVERTIDSESPDGGA